MKLRHHLRKLLAGTLHAAGIADPRRIPRNRLTVVALHRVLQLEQIAEYPLKGLAVTPAFLDELCKFVAHYFECVTVTDGLRAVRGKLDTDKPLLAVTFDDGRMDNFEQAAPVLARHEIPATFYIPAGFVGTDELLWHDELTYTVKQLMSRQHWAPLHAIFGKEIPTMMNAAAYYAADHVKPLPQAARETILERLSAVAGPVSRPDWEGSMDWLELNLLLERGHEIGSHTMTHAVLGGGRSVDQRHEIVDSKRLLERKLRVPIHSFSYPNGGLDESTEAIVRECGYESAVTTDEGLNNPDTNPLRLRRLNIQQSQNVLPSGELNSAILACRLTNVLGAR